MMPRAMDDEAARESPLTKWAVGGVLALLLVAVTAYGAALTSTLNDTVRRVTALETAFAALQASNVEQHRAMLDGVSRIERRLDAATAPGQR